MLTYIPSVNSEPLVQAFSNTNQIVINHNFGYKPMIQIILSDGTIAEGSVTHNSENRVTISFQISLSGEILLR